MTAQKGVVVKTAWKRARDGFRGFDCDAFRRCIGLALVCLVSACGEGPERPSPVTREGQREAKPAPPSKGQPKQPSRQVAEASAASKPSQRDLRISKSSGASTIMRTTSVTAVATTEPQKFVSGFAIQPGFGLKEATKMRRPSPSHSFVVVTTSVLPLKECSTRQIELIDGTGTRISGMGQWKVKSDSGESEHAWQAAEWFFHKDREQVSKWLFAVRDDRLENARFLFFGEEFTISKGAR